MHTSSVFKQKGKKNSVSSGSDKETPVSFGLKKDARVPMFLKRSAKPHIQSRFDDDVQVRRKVLDPAEEDVLEETGSSRVQRQSDEEIEISPKLEVGSPDDAFEQEADQVADQVMRMPENDDSPDMNRIDRQSGSLHVSRSCVESCRDCTDRLPDVQARSARVTTPSKKVTSVIQSPNGGSSLPKHIRSRIEPVLGHNLSHVTVHSDDSSRQAAESIHAKAFTHKNHIFLGSGQNANDSELMAHESTHVVQQQNVNSGNYLQRTDDDDITRMSITEEYAGELSDDELLRDIDFCVNQLQLFLPGEPEYQSAYENLSILDAEYDRRDIPFERVTGCTRQDEQSEPICLRAAGNATSGIQLYLTADLTENRAARVRIADISYAGPYLIAPNITSDEEDPEVVFYIAYHQERRQNEWVVGPDSIERFIENVGLYEGAANVAYPGSENIPETLSGQSGNTGRPLDDTLLDEGLHSGGGAGGLIAGYDAHMRLRHYVRPAQDLARRILADVEAGRIEHTVGRDMAVRGRNQALTQTRSRLSPGGRAFSRAMKEEGKTVEQLIERYSRRLIDNSPDIRARYGLDALDSGSEAYRSRYNQVLREIGQSGDVSTDIIRAAGRPNRIITGVARVNRILGPVGAAISIGISGYEIYDAPEGQRLHVAARETGGFIGGTLGAVGGGMAAGWVASLACGPGAPLCALAVSVIFIGAGGYIGGRVGEEALPPLLMAPAYITLALPAHSLSAGGGYSGLMQRDRQALLEASQPLWMRLNRTIYDVERDIESIEGRIRTAEDREQLQELQRLRLDLMIRLEDLHSLYAIEYPDYQRQDR